MELKRQVHPCGTGTGTEMTTRSPFWAQHSPAAPKEMQIFVDHSSVCTSSCSLIDSVPDMQMHTSQPRFPNQMCSLLAAGVANVQVSGAGTTQPRRLAAKVLENSIEESWRCRRLLWSIAIESSKHSCWPMHWLTEQWTGMCARPSMPVLQAPSNQADRHALHAISL